MKHISTIIGKQLPGQQGHAEISINPDAVKVVDDLFRILAEHTRYFRLNSGNQDEYNFKKREWVKTFSLAQVGENSVGRGINRIRTQAMTFQTITPGEFLALCAISPADISAPDVEAAYLEGCKNSHPSQTDKIWTHKAVRYATHKTGSHFLRTEPRAKTFLEFSKNYTEACQMFFDGKILDQIGNDSPALRRELDETKRIVAEGFEQFNSPAKALSALKEILK